VDDAYYVIVLTAGLALSLAACSDAPSESPRDTQRRQHQETMATLNELIRLEAEELKRLRAAQQKCREQYTFIVTETGRLQREVDDLGRYPKPLQGALLARAQKAMSDLNTVRAVNDEYNASCVRKPNRQ
jgi:hypothetical protein